MNSILTGQFPIWVVPQLESIQRDIPPMLKTDVQTEQSRQLNIPEVYEQTVFQPACQY